MRFARSRASAVAAALLCACAGPEGTATDLAEASVSLTQAPSDASCLSIAVIGAERTLERHFDLTASGRIVFALDGLPSGEVIFTARAYGSVCSAVTAASAHTWYGIPVRATLVPGQPANVTIAMHR